LPLGPQQVHDADFNIYTTVQIGDQVWLGQNLRTTKWQDGTEMVDKYTGPYYKNVNNNIINEFYYPDWIATDIESNPCPCNFHVPTHEDWSELESYLSMSETDIEILDPNTFRGENEYTGRFLKSTNGWNDFNEKSGNGTDLYGFNLIPSGVYTNDGEAMFLGEKAYTWSSSLNGTYTHIRIFSNESDGIISWIYIINYCSIRCVQD
jgi:uncharacterized protein (TIGR02145 family)